MAAVAPTSLATTPSRFYLPELDTLRFFAFLGVFIAHGPWSLTLGDPGTGNLITRLLMIAANSFMWGVDLFFVLSSYLITELLLREKERFGRVNVGAFCCRRALRIWPLYFVYLGAAYGFLRVIPLVSIPRIYFILCASVVGNFAFYAAHQAPSLIIGPLWRLSVEEPVLLDLALGR